ncbi:MAG TPA: hypothetical protein VMB50_16685 [Myxococcales bacterium]|nr:hypothetical protein [Myxococcales bacterium]
MAIIATQAKGIDPAKLEQELEQFDAGLLKNVPATVSLTINRAALTQGQIDTQIRGYLATLQAVDAAKQQHVAALVARDKMVVEARDFHLQLRRAVIAYFGTQSVELADFGLQPAKAKAERTSAQKAQQAAKAQLTREARGTTSRKQKLKINPGVAQPAVTIGADGTLTAIPPKVADGVVPTVNGAATGGQASPPQSAAASTTNPGPALPGSAG